MVDPKKVELTPYSKLPHMIAPVITEPPQAAEALRWLVVEMERRYEILKRMSLRHIQAFNERQRDEAFESSLGMEIPTKMAYIVCIIDELADLMMTSPGDIETPIARIAQMARAVGIHMILATQRPSREVITGLIKANFPGRISFKVASRVNSQIVLDENGAECLLGNGDMLFLHPTKGSLMRAQGAFIRDEDINRVIETIEMQAPPNYLLKPDLLCEFSESTSTGSIASKDELFEEARKLVTETGTASTTFLQRKLRIGYARAASLMDELEEQSIVSSSENGKPRRVLMAKENPLNEEDL
jgi:S-DNA-T family DNA segregation ATPase FtsK/SpoIIIE